MGQSSHGFLKYWWDSLVGSSAISELGSYFSTGMRWDVSEALQGDLQGVLERRLPLRRRCWLVAGHLDDLVKVFGMLAGVAGQLWHLKWLLMLSYCWGMIKHGGFARIRRWTTILIPWVSSIVKLDCSFLYIYIQFLVNGLQSLTLFQEFLPLLLGYFNSSMD